MNELRSTLKIFSTGSITLTAPSVVSIKRALEFIYPVLQTYKFNTPEPELKTAAPSIITNNTTTTSPNEITSITTATAVTAPTATTNSPQILKSNCQNLSHHNPALTVTSNHHHNLLNSNLSETQHQQAVANNSQQHYNHLHNHNHHNHHHVVTNPFESSWNHHLVVQHAGSFGYGSHPNVTGGSVTTNPGPPHSHHWFNDSLLIDNVLDDFLP